MPGVFFASRSARNARAASTSANSPITTRYQIPFSPRSTSTARRGSAERGAELLRLFRRALAILRRREVDDVDDRLSRPVGRQEHRRAALRDRGARGRTGRRLLRRSGSGLRRRRRRLRDGQEARPWAPARRALAGGATSGFFRATGAALLTIVALEDALAHGPRQARSDREDAQERHEPAPAARAGRGGRGAGTLRRLEPELLHVRAACRRGPREPRARGGISDMDVTAGSCRAGGVGARRNRSGPAGGGGSGSTGAFGNRGRCGGPRREAASGSSGSRGFTSGMAGADTTAGRGIGFSGTASGGGGLGRRGPSDFGRLGAGGSGGRPGARRRREAEVQLQLRRAASARGLGLRASAPERPLRGASIGCGDLERPARLARDGNDRGPEGRVLGLDRDLLFPVQLRAGRHVLEGIVRSGRPRFAESIGASRGRGRAGKTGMGGGAGRTRASPRRPARAAGAPA